MSYLDRLETAILIQTINPTPAPSPPRELAAALESIPEWVDAWGGRAKIVAAVRALPERDVDGKILAMTRDHATAIVEAVLNRRPMPDPIGEQVTRLRAQAEAAEAEHVAMRNAAVSLLPRMADIFRSSVEKVLVHLDGRLGEIVAQARELDVTPADFPTAASALRMRDEERSVLLSLEELATEYAEVRRAQADALGVKELTPAHCFANAEEFYIWGADAPWPGTLSRPDAAHLAWVATTPGVRAWVPTDGQRQEADDRLREEHARAEYDHLRKMRRGRGSALGPSQEQRLSTLERIVKGTPAEDIGPSENHRTSAETAAAVARHKRAVAAGA